MSKCVEKNDAKIYLCKIAITREQDAGAEVSRRGNQTGVRVRVEGEREGEKEGHETACWLRVTSE